MSAREHIETRLPLAGSRLAKIAETFSGRYGLNVVFQDGMCATDMIGTIVLPTNIASLGEDEMDLVWAKVNHEAEHVRVQAEMEDAAQDKQRHVVNRDIWAVASSGAMSGRAISDVVVTADTTPVGLLKSLLKSKHSNLFRSWWNAIEDVRIERRAGARYEGVFQFLKHGRDHAFKHWRDKLLAQPDAASDLYQTQMCVILEAFGYDVDFISPKARAAAKALAPLLQMLHPDALESFADGVNLTCAIVAAQLAATEDGDNGDDSTGDSDDPTDGGDGDDGDGDDGDGDDGDGDDGDDGDGDDGDGATSPASGSPFDGADEIEAAAAAPRQPGEPAPFDGDAHRKGGDSPDMAPVPRDEALRALGRSAPKLIESPIHIAADAAILAVAGRAPTNTAFADGATPYRVHPLAAEQDAIIRVRGSASQLQAVVGDTNRDALTLASRIRTLLTTMSADVRTYASRNGDLDRRSMWRANTPTKPDNIRSRVVPGKVHDVAIGMLGDCSGSMMGAKLRLMQQAIVLMGDTLDVIDRTTRHTLQFAAWGFTAGFAVGSGPYERLAPVTHYMWKDWDERWAAAKPNVAGPIQNMDNADPDSVKWAIKQVLSRPAKRHILLVFSDGQPAVAGNWSAIRRELKCVVQAASSAGVEVWGFGIMDDSVKHYYPNSRTCHNLTGLSQAVMEVAPVWFELHKRR